MADVAQLDVVLGAKVTGLEAGLNKAQKELAETAVAANKLDSALQKGVKGTNSATLALSNLGRVAQDAPFGFLGISNNLNPLLESFQRLRAESGSNAKALKALGSSLIGAGGLGFALSVVSSLLVVFGDKLFSSSKAADAAKDSFNGLLESTAKEALKLKESFAQITDANIPLENRKKIIKDLRAEYGVYLKNISDEALLTGKAAAAYELINNAIFKKLQLQALEGKILPFIQQQIDLQYQLAQLEKENADRRKFIDATAGSKNAKVQKDNAIAIAASNENLGEQYAIMRQLARVGKEIENIFSNIKPLLQFDDVAIQGITPAKVKEQIERLWFKDVDGKITFLPFPIKIPVTVEPKLKSKGSTEITKAYEMWVRDQMDALEGIGFKFPPLFLKFDSKTKERIIKDFKEIGDLTQQLTGDIFGKIAENMGNFQNPFAGIFEILGESLTKLGKYVIFSSELLSKVTAALNAALSGIPGAGIAVGVGLIALGQIFKNIPHMAAGGIVPPGYPNDSFPAMLQSNEAVIPLDKLSKYMPGGQQVVVMDVVMRGNTTVLTQRRAEKAYNQKY